MPDTRLLELLDTDINSCTELLEILEQEFSALNERKLEKLQALLDSKQPLLISLNQHAKERSSLLQRNGLTADMNGFQQFAQSSTHSAKLLQQHSTLNELIEQCQAANLRNGRLIRANQISVGAALNIIRGNNEPSLYDKSGSTAYKNTQRTFTSA